MRVAVLMSGCLLLIALCGCATIGSPPRRNTSAAADSTQVLIVNGVRYKCVRADGTWKCRSLAELQARLDPLTGAATALDASHR